MLASGTAEALLSAPVQNLIDVAMRRAEIEDGVGYFSGDDVRAELQTEALAAAQRFDPARGVRLTTFLWRRVHGAAVQLVRTKGRRTRAGLSRPPVLSLERSLIQQDQEDGEEPDGRFAESDDAAVDGPEEETALQADLILAVARLPTRMRMALYLLFYEQLEPDGAARRMRCSPEVIRELRDAALKKVRLALLSGP